MEIRKTDYIVQILKNIEPGRQWILVQPSGSLSLRRQTFDCIRKVGV